MAVENPYDISSYAILTPQELLELMFGLLIDNNEEFITPQRMRQVIGPIITSYAGRSSNISGTLPILFNQFSGAISIRKASASQDGYLSKEDFAVLSAGSTNAPLAPLEVRVFKKATGNTGGFTKETGDWVHGEPSAGVCWLLAIVGSDPEDYDTYEVKFEV